MFFEKPPTASLFFFFILFEGLLRIPAGLSSGQILLFPAVQFGTGSPAESLI